MADIEGYVETNLRGMIEKTKPKNDYDMGFMSRFGATLSNTMGRELKDGISMLLENNLQQFGKQVWDLDTFPRGHQTFFMGVVCYRIKTCTPLYSVPCTTFRF